MKLAKIALTFAVVAALLLLVAGPGTRLGLWDFRFGFLLMRWALFVGLAAAVVSVILLLIPKTRAGNGTLLVVAVLVSLGTAWLPYNGYRTARSLPFIHDITTDTVNPPPFVAILPLRADASNPPEYAGAETAKLQQEGYPDLQSLTLSGAPAQVLQKALKTVEDMGMEVVAVEPDEGRIEATATTFWFGFKDDVVIRVEPAGTGSKLDIRSKSRVGRSDVGANAARIRRFMDMLQS
ncbi:MAG: DUF1499 domain-containing protein [Woeseia sp.]|nr:DUF1499 domain-containing protein [Woeseia sp.]